MKRSAFISHTVQAVCILGMLLTVAAGVQKAMDQRSPTRRYRGLELESRIDLGSGRANEKISFSLRLTNHSDQPHRITGARQSCECVYPVGLPLEVAPNSMEEVKMSMKVPNVEETTDYAFKVELLSESSGWLNPSVVLMNVEPRFEDEQAPLQPVPFDHLSSADCAAPRR